jgi:hypothetical protein
MAINDKGNIIASAATIWYAPVGEPLPNSSTIIAGAAWGGNWKSLGYTIEPVAFEHNVETYDIMVEQLTPAVRTQRTKIDASIKTVLAEFIGDNLKLATDGTLTVQVPTVPLVGSDTIVGKADTTDVSLWTIGFEGIRVHSTNAKLPVRLFLHSASVILDGPISFGKGATVGIPITAKGFADNANNLFTIHNVTAPHT